jgi:hypothetical protein
MDIDQSKGPKDSAQDLSDEAEVEDTLESNLSQAGYQVLELIYLRTMPTRKLIVCTLCGTGIPPTVAESHYSAKHKIILTKEKRRSLLNFLQNGNFESDLKDVDLPKPLGPPFHGLHIHDGYACKICTYSCPNERSMNNHIAMKHQDAQGPAKQNFQPAKLQAFVKKHPRYFTVTPILHDIRHDDLFSVYMRTEAPKVDNLRLFNPPQSENEVPPLLKVLQWHTHLEPHLHDPQTAARLLEIWTLPTATRGLSWAGNRLRYTIEAYLRDIRHKALNTTMGARRLLMVCPRFVDLF